MLMEFLVSREHGRERCVEHRGLPMLSSLFSPSHPFGSGTCAGALVLAHAS